jgi:hypothetical protein
VTCKNKIWIVTKWCAYEREDIDKVFDSYEKANAYWESKDSESNGYDNPYYELYEWEVE